MCDVMVDLETTGMRPGCAILSIGAVAFCPKTNRLGAEMYDVVNLKSCQAVGLTTQESTMKWWNSQSKEARKVLQEAESDDAISIAAALERFNLFLCRFGKGTVRVWGNGSDFDNALLAACYGATGAEPGWSFWNNRCYRTLKNLAPHIKIDKKGTIAHNALDDAKTQAQHAMDIFATMNNKENLHAGLRA